MKKIIFFIIILLAMGAIWYEILTRSSDAPQSPQGPRTSSVYSNTVLGFSLRLPSFVASTTHDAPDSYVVDESYRYQTLGPGKDISGIKFTIPVSLARGTNLSYDSYISVEQLPQTHTCTAGLFVGGAASTSIMVDAGVSYSVARTGDAGVGNRYEETVYAFPQSNPCTAVRYFIHYAAIDNYDRGSVKEFDKQSLLIQFDLIRRTVILQ